MSQVSLTSVYLATAFAESAVYGFLLCLFIGTMHLSFSKRFRRAGRTAHSLTMALVSSAMVILATLHLVVTLYQVISAFSSHAKTAGGPVAHLVKQSTWANLTKSFTYGTQVLLGSAVAIYRCWILWKKSWKVVGFSCLLWVVQAVSGFRTFSLLPSVTFIFDQPIYTWILLFYVSSMIQCVLTSGLMAYRIWTTLRGSLTDGILPANVPNLSNILQILVECAALQLLIELILLVLFVTRSNAQFIALGTVSSVIAITFNAMTVRIRLLTITEDNADTFPQSLIAFPSHTQTYAQSIGMHATPIDGIRIHVEVDEDNSTEDHASAKLRR